MKIEPDIIFVMEILLGFTCRSSMNREREMQAIGCISLSPVLVVSPVHYSISHQILFPRIAVFLFD